MAARKKATRKKSAAKKTTAKKATRKKATTRKVTRKVARKKATPKKATRKAGVKKTPEAPPPEPKPAPAPARKKATGDAAPKAPPAKKTRSGVSSMDVNLGHAFTLRPRVNTGFRPDDFRAAKEVLQDEDYPTLEEATRAVAAKALEIRREGGTSKGIGRSRQRS